MWTDTTRAQYARADLALPSDLTDAEWALLEPFLPPPSHVGRPRKWPLRRIVAAILYLLGGGLPWRMLPPCFPPVSTVRRWFWPQCIIGTRIYGRQSCAARNGYFRSLSTPSSAHSHAKS